MEKELEMVSPVLRLRGGVVDHAESFTSACFDTIARCCQRKNEFPGCHLIVRVSIQSLTTDRFRRFLEPFPGNPAYEQWWRTTNAFTAAPVCCDTGFGSP